MPSCGFPARRPTSASGCGSRRNFTSRNALNNRLQVRSCSSTRREAGRARLSASRTRCAQGPVRHARPTGNAGAGDRPAPGSSSVIARIKIGRLSARAAAKVPSSCKERVNAAAVTPPHAARVSAVAGRRRPAAAGRCRVRCPAARDRRRPLHLDPSFDRLWVKIDRKAIRRCAPMKARACGNIRRTRSGAYRTGRRRRSGAFGGRRRVETSSIAVAPPETARRRAYGTRPERPSPGESGGPGAVSARGGP
jgi:hypothetical protein